MIAPALALPCYECALANDGAIGCDPEVCETYQKWARENGVHDDAGAGKADRQGGTAFELERRYWQKSGSSARLAYRIVEHAIDVEQTGECCKGPNGTSVQRFGAKQFQCSRCKLWRDGDLVGVPTSLAERMGVDTDRYFG